MAAADRCFISPRSLYLVTRFDPYILPYPSTFLDRLATITIFKESSRFFFVSVKKSLQLAIHRGR